MKTLVKNATFTDGSVKNLLINENIIESIGSENIAADKVIDASNKLILPSFYNMHTHAAMTLFRGYGEDRALMDWLMNYIWPAEAHLNPELVCIGTKLACLEMIKTGTTCFLDMYWHLEGAFQAVDEMGLRAVLCSVMFDNFDSKETKAAEKRCAKELETYMNRNERIKIGLGPHAIYTVSSDLYKWCEEVSRDKNILIHTHLSETEHEVNESLKNFGCRPVEHLHRAGLLSERLFAAHSCWLTDDEIALYAENNVKAITNPVSNLKLASGAICPIAKLEDAGVKVLIGTDGCSSNNNLDMLEEMKFAAVLQKHLTLDPTRLPAPQVLDMGTKDSARAIGLNSGELKEGALADLVLVDLNNCFATPATDHISNLVYSMNGSQVDTTICNGKILMENGHVPGEEKILADAREAANKILQ